MLSCCCFGLPDLAAECANYAAETKISRAERDKTNNFDIWFSVRCSTELFVNIQFTLHAIFKQYLSICMQHNILQRIQKID